MATHDRQPSVLFVQPALAYPDEPIAGRHQTVRQQEQYIEIGLLSIASFLSAKHIPIHIINLADGQSGLADLSAVLLEKHPILVAIGCMSGYAYPGVKECCRVVKSIDEKIVTLSGGQHIGPLGPLALQEIAELDVVARYEGELTTLAVYQALLDATADFGGVPGTVSRRGTEVVSCEVLPRQAPLEELAPLNYGLFPGFEEFVPRLEESRGCPFDCSFCSNASVFTFVVRYKPVDCLVRELTSIYMQYGEPEVLRFYLISKNYGLDSKATLRFAEAVRELPFRAEWRTQTRADIMPPAILPPLSEAGLRILDVGLESASPTMLRLMNKAADPQAYLSRAQRLFEAFETLPGTVLKINLIFHPGERQETIAETIAFLSRWKHVIRAVTAAPVMVDPGAPLWRALPSFEREHGTRRVGGAFWESQHIYPVDPSSTLTFDECNAIASQITKTFQTEEMYFVTRSFGGLNRHADRAQVRRSMQSVPSGLRPYSA